MKVAQQTRDWRLPREVIPETVFFLASALRDHDATASGHAERIGALVADAAARLGLGEWEAWTVRQAAVLHDVGKMGVSGSILDKPGKLSEDEWEVVRRHPEIGAAMLAGIDGFEGVAEVVLAHHERFDGRGYPARLSGEEIPIEARLISVVDAYDAMTNDRPYREAMSHEEAIAELEAGAGNQFDPSVVGAVKAVLGERDGTARR